MRFSIAIFCARMTFFVVIGKEGAGFDGGVVDDQHDHAGLDAGESGDDAGGGRASPFFVHAVGGVEAEFEESTGVGEQVDALAGGQAVLGVLALDGLRTSALADFFFFVANLGNQIGKSSHVRFIAQRGRIEFGGEHVVDRDRGGFGTVGHVRA